MEVEIERTDKGLRVRTRYPKGRQWRRQTGSVHYSVRLPSSAHLRVESVNGPVDATGFHGDVSAQTVNGPVRLEGLGGSVDARTVNGRIECALARFTAEQEHSFRTVNGRVQLALGPDADGEVDARAVNGRISFELAGATALETNRRRQKVRVGDGGGACRVRTINGAIRVIDR